MHGFIVCNMTFKNLNEVLDKMYSDEELLEFEIKSFIMDKEYELQNISSKVKGIITKVILDINPYITFSVISDYYLSKEELYEIKNKLAEILKDKFIVIEENYYEDIFNNYKNNIEAQRMFTLSISELMSLKLVMNNMDYSVFTGIVLTNRILTLDECPVEIFNSLKEKILSSNFELLEKAELYVLMKLIKALNLYNIRALFVRKNIIGYDTESFINILSDIGTRIEKYFFSPSEEKESKQDVAELIKNNREIFKSKISELKEYRDELLLDVTNNLEAIKYLSSQISSLENKL